MEREHDGGGEDDTGDVKFVKEEYQEHVLDKVREAGPKEGRIERMWMAMHSALAKTADGLFGRIKSSQPDCFYNSAEELRPLLQLRNVAHL